MTTPSIVEFLRARIEEDRALAQAAIDDIYGPDDCWFETSNEQIVDHYRHHQPDRVLREVEAKRRIMERHTNDGPTFARYCRGCPEDRDGFPDVFVEECPELRDLATIYSDSPDYREEWKP
jgi:hypothetical protein